MRGIPFLSMAIYGSYNCIQESDSYLTSNVS